MLSADHSSSFLRKDPKKYTGGEMLLLRFEIVGRRDLDGMPIRKHIFSLFQDDIPRLLYSNQAYNTGK